MSTVIVSEEQIDEHERVLQGGVHQSDSRGRAILTILYLVVLGLCFVVPVFYYFRMHMEDRRLRRLREMQLQSVIAGLEDTSPEVREEMRAARRKYREEKRARIVQLFAPVQMVISSMNYKERDSEKQISCDLEEGGIAADASKESTWQDELTCDDDNICVEIPVQGLLVTPASSSLQSSLYDSSPQRRLVPNLCAICLSSYEVGESIVWSSNPSCEHAFHNPCMERWLLKQRGRPLCPCCRRDFVVDPLDEEETAESGIPSPQMSQEDGSDDLLLEAF
mmetsp:Transcript_3552/g.5953  ORF Transcript_3552/g.5953 Transcript_3552/m.5953 type:complete len:279 (+) Transcript_3552:161-997(+)